MIAILQLTTAGLMASSQCLGSVTWGRVMMQLRQSKSNATIDQTKEILSCEISDEALESAAGINRAANYTLYYCTALDLCPGP